MREKVSFFASTKCWYFLGVKAMCAATFYGITVRLGREKRDMKGHGSFLCVLWSKDGNFQQLTTRHCCEMSFVRRSHNAVRQTPSTALRPIVYFIFQIKTHKRIWSGSIMHWKSIDDEFNNGLGTKIDLLMFILKTMHWAWLEHGVMCFCLSSNNLMWLIFLLGTILLWHLCSGVDLDD